MLRKYAVNLGAVILVALFGAPSPGFGAFGSELDEQLMTLLSDPNDELAEKVFRDLFHIVESARSRKTEPASRITMFLWLADTNCGVNAILEASQSKYGGVRHLAIGLLGRSGSTEAMSRLIEIYKDPWKGIDEQILMAASRQEGIEKPLEDQKQTFVLNMRLEMLEVFSRSPDERITELLIERLPIASGKEKIHVARILGEKLGEAALPIIVPLLDDEECRNSTVLNIISHIGGEESEKILLSSLVSILENGGSFYGAVQNLRRVCTSASVPTLIRALQKPMRINIRIVIFQALGRVGNDEAIDALADQFSNEAYCLYAVKALSQTDNPRGARAVMSLLKEKDLEKNYTRRPPRHKYSLTSACVRVLGDIGCKEAISTIKMFLNSESHELRLEALAGLAKLENSRWLNKIYPFLDLDGEEFENLEAEAYLGKTDKPEDRKRRLRERVIEILVESENREAIAKVLRCFAKYCNDPGGPSYMQKSLSAGSPQIIHPLLEFLVGRDFKDGDPFTWTVIRRLAEYRDERTLDILKRAYDEYRITNTDNFHRDIADVQKIIAQALIELTGDEYKYFYMIPFE